MRIVRLVATPVILLTLLGMLLWSASWGWRSMTAPLPSPSPTPCVIQAVKAVEPGNVSVRILNGGFTSGLATKVGKQLKTYGFKIAKTGNTDQRVTKTVVVGNASEQAQLDLVASYFNGATIQHDDRIDGTVDVLVGTQFEEYAKSPLKEVAVEDGNICVPPSPEPSPSPSAKPS